MPKFIVFCSVMLAISCVAAAPAHKDFDPTSRFIFYAVQEGLYEDGVSSDDVAQILLKNEKESYFHFIYACPICTATIWGLEAYRSRPVSFYSLKMPASTFGPGLSPKLHAQLYSEDSNQRLLAINSLVRSWIERRMTMLKLSTKERTALEKDLKAKREQGMRVLESFRKGEHGEGFGVAQAAPAYVNMSECAVCNGAVGKVMKLPDEK
jgi:hypothetical protein